jgi:chromosome segregation ATPase
MEQQLPSKEELKSLALDVLLFTNGNVDLAETLYHKGFLDFEDLQEIKKIYDEIVKLKTATEKQSKKLEDNINDFKVYFSDILKDKQQTEELIASLEERIQNLKDEKSKFYSQLFQYEEPQIVDEIISKLSEVYYQIDTAEKTIEFLKYGVSGIRKDKEKYNKIKQIFDLDISDVIEKETGQKIPRGKLVQIKCPLHSDKNPSFAIYKDTNSFYCFGCQVGGNVITFIAKLHNFNNERAIEYLIDHYAI